MKITTLLGGTLTPKALLTPPKLSLAVGVWQPMFDLHHDWEAWSGVERAAVAALALCIAVVLVAWVGV